MTTAKAAELVRKLARVAAPNSGASEAERANAALEACKLIHTHNLFIGEGPPVIQRQPPPPQRYTRSDIQQMVVEVMAQNAQHERRREEPTKFRPAVAAEDTYCGVETCGGPIFQNERVWRRLKNGKVEYVHADCWTS